MIDHNVSSGPLKRCQICGSPDLKLVLDVGHQPLCDSLLTKEQLDQPETYYPLRLMRCPSCTLTQLDFVVPGTEVYHPRYPYRTGITRELVEYQRRMAADLTARYGLDENSLVVDIGANDGTLLQAFKANGVRVLGVEPTCIAEIARKEGIETIQAPFDEQIAREIASSHGSARLITASNVFAHMAALGDVTRGIRTLLSDDGVFVLENHYLVDVLDKAQYDTIYHEHLRTYTLKSLVTLFSCYDMPVILAERVSRYAGNLRAHVAKRDTHPADSSVAVILRAEQEFGLEGDNVYETFCRRVEESRDRLLDLAVTAANRGESFVGNSCPGRSNTLLHYCGIGKGLMPYIAEQPNSLKKGLYSPGKHIPVVDNSILLEQQPDYVVLLAWHLADPISTDLRRRGLKSKLIQPLPVCTVLDV